MPIENVFCRFKLGQPGKLKGYRHNEDTDNWMFNCKIVSKRIL